jgi:hypothetical protein
LHAAYNSFVTYDYYVWSTQRQGGSSGLSSISASVAIGAGIVGAITLVRLLTVARTPSPRA